MSPEEECGVKDGLLLAFLQNCRLLQGQVSRRAVPLHGRFSGQQTGLNQEELKSVFSSLSSDPPCVWCLCKKALKCLYCLSLWFSKDSH